MVLSIFKPSRDNKRDVIGFLCRQKPCPISPAERHKITGTNKLLLHHDKWVRNRHFIRLNAAWMNDEGSVKLNMLLHIYITYITHIKYAIKLHCGNQYEEFYKWRNILLNLCIRIEADTHANIFLIVLICINCCSTVAV